MHLRKSLFGLMILCRNFPFFFFVERHVRILAKKIDHER